MLKMINIYVINRFIIKTGVCLLMFVKKIKYLTLSVAQKILIFVRPSASVTQKIF